HLPNSLVSGVHDEEISGAVDRHTSWAPQQSESRRSAVPAKTNRNSFRHSGDRPRRGHLPNSIIIEGHDEEISCTVDHHTTCSNHLSGSRRSAAPAWTIIISISRHSGDRPRRGHLSNSIVTGVRDEEISGAVDRHTHWTIQLSGNSRSAVPAK